MLNTFEKYLDNQNIKDNFFLSDYDVELDNILLNKFKNNIHNNPEEFIRFLFAHPWLDIFDVYSCYYSTLYKNIFIENKEYYTDIILYSLIKWMIYTDDSNLNNYINNNEYDYVKVDNKSAYPSKILIGKCYFQVFNRLELINNIFNVAYSDYKIYKDCISKTSFNDYFNTYLKIKSTLIKDYLVDKIYYMILNDKLQVDFNKLYYMKDIIIKLFKLSLEREDEDFFYQLLNLVVLLKKYKIDFNIFDENLPAEKLPTAIFKQEVSLS